MVLIEFPDMAKASYTSREHQKIGSLRADNTINDLILVVAVRPEFTVAGYAQQVRAPIAAVSTLRADPIGQATDSSSG